MAAAHETLREEGREIHAQPVHGHNEVFLLALLHHLHPTLPHYLVPLPALE
jgi:hypothetical protein